jgi:hypothetical protein
VDPALLSQALDRPVTDQETFMEEFKKVALSVVDCLKEKPVIVAHSENTFDGSGVKRLLSNKFELDKVLFLVHCHILLCYFDTNLTSNIDGKLLYEKYQSS